MFREGEMRGELGVRHLRRFWYRQEDVDWVTTNTLLCGLHVGLQETFDYLLRHKPSFADFEAWTLTKNGGGIDATRIERLNAGLSEAGTQGDPADPAAEPVLSAADIAFWDENGYVVLHDAVPPQNREAAVRAICGFLGADLKRPETWYRGHRATVSGFLFCTIRRFGRTAILRAFTGGLRSCGTAKTCGAR